MWESVLLYHLEEVIRRGISLSKVTEQKDLGVIFQDNFSFDTHLDSAVNRSFRSLGFIIRSASRFNANTLIYLYKSLVRQILLYNSVIWSPHYESHIRRLESVQRKFLRFLAFKLGRPFSFDDHNYREFAFQDDLCS